MKFRRRKFLINMRFQLRYIGAVIALVLLLSLIHLLLLHVLTERVVRANEELVALGRDNSDLVQNVADIPDEEKTRVELGYKTMVLNKVKSEHDLALLYRLNFVYLVLVLIVIFIYGIYSTHRIAGPLYVMKQMLEQYDRGTFSDQRDLRSKDEFKDVFTLLKDALKQEKEK